MGIGRGCRIFGDHRLKNPNWKVSEDAILHEYYPYKYAGDLVTLLPGRTKSGIKTRAERLGIKKSLLYRPPKTKYTLNHSFFSFPSTESCYWAGFLAADGCITNNRQLRLALSTNDRQHLEVFRDTLQYTGEIVYNIPQPIGEYFRDDLRISSPQVLYDLETTYSITPRKTLTLMPPSIRELKYVLPFIAGFIDGDGCIHIKDESYLGIAFVGTYSMMRWIKGWVEELTSGKYRIPKIQPHGKVFQFCLIGERAERFLTRIYNQTYKEAPLLARKWNIFLEYIRS